ncbi:MAG: shikimate dehydrogenase [Flavobacteriaceae bacterium]
MTKKEKKRVFGLIGKNIDYSFSRNYFSSKFKKEGLSNCSYDNFDLKTIDQFKEILQMNPLPAGLNVTIPYKKEIIPFLDNISQEAQSIGAVNTIVWDKKGNTTGHNTDHVGFKKAVLESMSYTPENALILGTGGASGAVKYVLEQLNCNHTFVSRNPRDGQLNYTDLNANILNQVDLIINTTPLGTFPNTKARPSLPYNLVNSQHFLFDLIYNPEETTFMKLGKEKGASSSNGYKMLIFQAEKAWQLWNQ